MSQPSFVIEVAARDQRGVERDVRRGGLFVAAAAYPMDDLGEVVFRFPDGEVRTRARVVFVDPSGVGLELELTPGARTALADRLAAHHAAGGAETAAHADAAIPADTMAREDAAIPADTMAREDAAEPGHLDDLAALGEAEDPDEAGDGPTTGEGLPAPVHVRLRNLSVAEQLKIAHRGEHRERVVLERMYGKLVWDALLRNPRITVPEVARIARMGTLPKPLAELIASNAAWLQVPEIRRALLGNPRLPAELIPRLLRILPRHELRLLPTQTAYPAAVRDWARRLLRL
ncbi:MAG: hypothetical protein IPI49_10905 [Myxococcales bacterium]|nr:hypothetical protein [Myxococcales bacterium]